jgi:hypothetical protein
MAAQKQLSHQFSGEPSLPQRLAATSQLHLEREGENVAMAANSDQAHQALMSSPPHRDNLLSPTFNVAGFGVFRSGHMLYVAQDFGSSLPSYSVRQAQELVSASVEQLRAQAKLPRLQRVDNGSTQTSACAMAQADSLSAAARSRAPERTCIGCHRTEEQSRLVRLVAALNGAVTDKVLDIFCDKIFNPLRKDDASIAAVVVYDGDLASEEVAISPHRHGHTTARFFVLARKAAPTTWHWHPQVRTRLR